jgi:hypothetical protein
VRPGGMDWKHLPAQNWATTNANLDLPCSMKTSTSF